MTDRPTNEEREALIAGDRAGALEPHEADELALLADLLASPSTWAEPSAGLEDAVVRAVADAQPTAIPRVTPGATQPRRAITSKRGPVVVLALAAAAVIAIVVTTLLVTRGASSPDYSAQLGATGLAPGAHASADITRNAAGFRITLDARRLPPLQSDEYYQAWLKNAGGTLVPIGTFSSSDGRVTLWSGVSPKDFPTITVTIEPIDNDQASSGRRVLVGEIHAT
jgi:Anti-sigma-K factor rskA, C-terminal